MEEKLQTKIEDTFNVLDSIKEAEVNHFFKHKVLQEIRNQKENRKQSSVIPWFTPQLQLAMIAVVIFLNVFTIYTVFSSNNSHNLNNIETFAEEYALKTSNSYLYN